MSLQPVPVEGVSRFEATAACDGAPACGWSEKGQWHCSANDQVSKNPARAGRPVSGRCLEKGFVGLDYSIDVDLTDAFRQIGLSSTQSSCHSSFRTTLRRAKLRPVSVAPNLGAVL